MGNDHTMLQCSEFITKVANFLFLNNIMIIIDNAIILYKPRVYFLATTTLTIFQNTT